MAKAEAADKLRKNIDAAEYKHVVLGLIFLKYISCLENRRGSIRRRQRFLRVRPDRACQGTGLRPDPRSVCRFAE